MTNKHLEVAWVRRVCRVYKTNVAAGRALGISDETLAKKAKEWGIETPAQRHRRWRKEQREFALDEPPLLDKEPFPE